MRQEGAFSIHAPQTKVWSFFIDPVRLSSCVDDPHTLEILDENTFQGEVKSGVGPVRGTFKGSAKIVERDPPRRARIKAHGAGMGSAFDVDSTVEMSEYGGGTTGRWGADGGFHREHANGRAPLLPRAHHPKTKQIFLKST